MYHTAFPGQPDWLTFVLHTAHMATIAKQKDIIRNTGKGIDDAQAIQKLLNIQLRYLVGSINRPLFVLGLAQ